MKYLVIIATRDFSKLWNNQTDFIATDRTVCILKKGEGRSETPLTAFPAIITSKIKGNNDCELGVIFHKISGSEEGNALRETLKTSFNDKLAFCEWYSSTLNDFWSESNADADLPYNNLKKAWKDDVGNKEETFDAVWNFFLGDTQLEKLLQPFAAFHPMNTTDLVKEKAALKEKVRELLNGK